MCGGPYLLFQWAALNPSEFAGWFALGLCCGKQWFMFVLPRLPILSLVLTFRVTDTIAFPDVPGHVWKGMLGNALMSEGLKDHRGHGLFESLFAPTAETCLALPDRGEKPAAIVLDMPGAAVADDAHKWRLTADEAPRGTNMVLGVTLFGVAASSADVIVNQLAHVAAAGLGKASANGARGTAALARVQLRDQTGSLRDVSLNVDNMLSIAATVPLIPATAPRQALVQFVSPLRIDAPTGRGSDKSPLLARQLDAVQFAATLMRRIAALSACHGDETVPLDGLKTALEGLRFSSADLVDCGYMKWSARQQREIRTTGVLGSAVIDLSSHSWLWPWLYLAQFTHVGKDTVEGMGGLRVGNVERS